MWMLALAAAWAGCTLDALELDLAGARMAAEEGRLARSRVRVLEEQLACTTVPVPAETVAQIHTVLGLFHTQSGDHEKAASHFLGAWDADPYWRPPPTLPPAAPARLFYESRREQRSTDRRPTLPMADTLLVDGLASQWRPADQPAVLQRDGEGAFVVAPEQPVPRAGQGARSGRLGLRFAGIGALVVSGATYGGAWAARGSYQKAVERDAPDDERVAPHTANRALSLTSLGLLGLGGAMVAVSF